MCSIYTPLSMAPPERFELPTNRFEAGYSIQLSYGGVETASVSILVLGPPERIRTSDLRLRRATLYPAELRADIRDAGSE